MRPWRLSAVVCVAGLAWTAAPANGFAQQQTDKPARIGLIAFADGELRSHLDHALMEGLRAQGYVENTNLIVERRYAAGRPERVPQIANELGNLKLDVILTTCTPTTRAMKAVKQDAPLVMAAVSDPVGQGLIASYAHPGGNITGTASQFEDVAAKMLQLFHEAVPQASSIAVLLNPRNPVHKVFLTEMEAVAVPLSLKLARREIGHAEDIPTTFDALRHEGIEAVIVLPTTRFSSICAGAS